MPSLTDAIEAKYNCDNFEHNDPEDGSFVIFAPKRIPITGRLSELVLNECNIDTAGDLKQLKLQCENVQELDLSHNHLSSWDEVLQTLSHIPTLKFLNLSYNDLSEEFTPAQSLRSEYNFPNLETFVLIGTGITWSSIWSLLSNFSGLKTFHLSLNKLSDISSPPVGETQQFCTVNQLMFDGNLVSEWTQIAKLGQIFPSLKQLSLSNCPLRLQLQNSVVVGGLEIEKCFPNLEVLNLCSTRLDTEDEIMMLNSFPKLKELRITGIPFLERVEAKQKRQDLIALLPKIQKLNGGADISQEERDGAERYFIRKFLNVNEKPVRYFELVQKHGQLDPLVEVKLRPVTKVTLKIKFGNSSIDQEVNLRQSVKALKKSLEPIVGLPSSRMNLYYLDLGMSDGADILRFPDKQLYTYNMHNGDEIHVEIKNNSSREISQS